MGNRIDVLEEFCESHGLTPDRVSKYSGLTVDQLESLDYWDLHLELFSHTEQLMEVNR